MIKYECDFIVAKFDLQAFCYKFLNVEFFEFFEVRVLFTEFSYDISLYYSNHGSKKGGSVAHWFRPLDFRIHRLGYLEVTGSSLTAVMLVNSPPETL